MQTPELLRTHLNFRTKDFSVQLQDPDLLARGETKLVYDRLCLDTVCRTQKRLVLGLRELPSRTYALKYLSHSHGQ